MAYGQLLNKSEKKFEFIFPGCTDKAVMTALRPKQVIQVKSIFNKNSGFLIMT